MYLTKSFCLLQNIYEMDVLLHICHLQSRKIKNYANKRKLNRQKHTGIYWACRVSKS